MDQSKDSKSTNCQNFGVVCRGFWRMEIGYPSFSLTLKSPCANNFNYQNVAMEHRLNAAIAYSLGHASILTKVSKDLPTDLFSRSKELGSMG